MSRSQLHEVPSTRATPHRTYDVALRGAAAVGLLGTGVIHLLDLSGKMKETPYLGVLYILLIAGCVLASLLFLREDPRPAWILALALTAATFTAYVVNRTVGLPAATDDIGNWTEPLGVASLVVEGSVVVLSVVALRLARYRPRTST